jgi:hypothetical protein
MKISRIVLVLTTTERTQKNIVNTDTFKETLSRQNLNKMAEDEFTVYGKNLGQA